MLVLTNGLKKHIIARKFVKFGLYPKSDGENYLRYQGGVAVRSHFLQLYGSSQFTKSNRRNRMASDIKLLDGDQVLVEGGDLVVDRVQPAGQQPSSVALNLRNPTGFWHISGPRTYETGNPLCIFWNDNSQWSGAYLTINTAGNVGIGVSNPGYKLDVADRMRVRQAYNTAGIWFYQTKPAKDQAFVGMSSDTQVGFWGNTGAGWGFVMDTTTGNVSFGAKTRQMINLWNSDYGIGVQTGTQYFRSASDFCWFKGGTHHDAQNNPGKGTRLMAVNGWGDLILSARTNPEASTNKPLCRALVDLGNKLSINHENDFVNGVNIFNARFVTSRNYITNTATLSLEEATLALQRLSPVKFNYGNDPEKDLHVGFIAEDVPDLVATRDRTTIGALDIVAVLTKVVQEQHQQIAQLVTEVNALKQAQKLPK